MDEQQLKTNLTSSKHWVRLVYMVLFAFFLYIAAFVMTALVVVQFLFSLLTGSDNLNLRSFSHSLTTYIQQALMFLSFNSEFKPFPFADWPEAPVHAEPVEEVAPAATTAEPDYRATSTPTPAGNAVTTPIDEPSEPAVKGDAEPERDPPLVDPDGEKKVLS